MYGGPRHSASAASNQLDRLVGPGVTRLDPFGHHPVESVAVELVVRHVEEVTTVAVDESVGWEDAAGAARRASAPRRTVSSGSASPHSRSATASVARGRLACRSEGGDEPALQIAAQRDRGAVAARHGERPEHAITGLAVPGHAARVYELAADTSNTGWRGAMASSCSSVESGPTPSKKAPTSNFQRFR